MDIVKQVSLTRQIHHFVPYQFFIINSVLALCSYFVMQSAFVITSAVPADNCYQGALDQVIGQKLLLCSLARCSLSWRRAWRSWRGLGEAPAALPDLLFIKVHKSLGK